MGNVREEGRSRLARQTRPQFQTLRVHRAGNSLGVCLPKGLSELLDLRHGDEVRVYVVNGVLCFQPTKQDAFTPAVGPNFGAAP